MEELKNIRKLNKLSFNDMAKELNISKTYYWQLEHDQRRISYEMAIKIASIFKKKSLMIFFIKNLSKKQRKKFSNFSTIK